MTTRRKLFSILAGLGAAIGFPVLKAEGKPSVDSGQSAPHMDLLYHISDEVWVWMKRHNIRTQVLITLDDEPAKSTYLLFFPKERTIHWTSKAHTSIADAWSKQIDVPTFNWSDG